MSKTKYTKELLASAVSNSTSYAGVLRFLGLKQAGGTQSHIASKVSGYGIDTSHFTGQSHGLGTASTKRKTAEQVLVVKIEGSLRSPRFQLYRAMLEVGFLEKCNKCGTGTEWRGESLTLEINHIDGNWLDSREHNVEFLCPNCHSQDRNTNRPHKYRK